MKRARSQTASTVSWRFARDFLNQTSMYWLGIDVGTGGTRALLVDARGKVRHSFTSSHEDMRMERPLWAEQRPENWWDAAQLAIRGVLGAGGASGKDVRGIGVSGWM